MKRILAMVLALTMAAGMTACGSKAAEPQTEAKTEAVAETQAVKEAEEPKTAESTEAETKPAETEEAIEDEGWDQLEALGNIETENGILTASITYPKDLVGEDITQEEIDAKAGENYISGKLNEDGSVTYKMTKKQHKEMMDGVASSIEETLKDMVESEDYSFTEIKHNKDYTEFDVTISGEELTFSDSIATLGFYMYGGMYGIFTGAKADHVVVNYYNANGDLISSADSDNMGD